MSISQKDGVYNCIEAYCAENRKEFEDGMKCELDTSARKAVIGMLIAATNAGVLEVKSPKARSDLNLYWNGTLSNWLRKDKRLNGNVKHEIKNPGSRQGAGDKQLKALKQLLSKVKGTEHEVEVQGHIDTRMSELEVIKAKEVEIDGSQIPDELLHLLT